VPNTGSCCCRQRVMTSGRTSGSGSPSMAPFLLSGYRTRIWWPAPTAIRGHSRRGVRAAVTDVDRIGFDVARRASSGELAGGFPVQGFRASHRARHAWRYRHKGAIAAQRGRCPRTCPFLWSTWRIRPARHGRTRSQAWTPAGVRSAVSPNDSFGRARNISAKALYIDMADDAAAGSEHEPPLGYWRTRR
jgi:hypothetical protein